MPSKATAPDTPRPKAAMLVIGDEILSGRTQDTNTHFLAGELTNAGIDLAEVRVVADDEAAIVNAVRTLSAGYDHVFTSGGIGPTHDDITADCIARAFDVAIGIRDDARALLAAHYATRDQEFNAARQRMARIPDGAVLIDNPISVAPGFTLNNVHVLAGVPQVFRAMLDGLLPRLAGGAPLHSDTMRIDQGEGDIAGPLAELAAAFPALSIGSYPFWQYGKYGSNIVVRGGDKALVDTAMAKLTQMFGATS